jgi:hypothetical protein
VKAFFSCESGVNSALLALTTEPIVTESIITARFASFGARYWFSFARAAFSADVSPDAPTTVPAVPTVL